MRKSGFLFATMFALILLLLCGCEPKEKVDTPSNHTCIECGNAASHYMGKQWINYSTIDLYYCDSCYDKVIKEAEENNRIVDEVWWE